MPTEQPTPTICGVLDAHGVKYRYAECCDGWAKLVDLLVGDLIRLGWDRDLHQIKEKFGGLRFYIGVGDAAVFDRIGAAEDESVLVCETCGAPGKNRNTNGWWRTRCDACATPWEGE